MEPIHAFVAVLWFPRIKTCRTVGQWEGRQVNGSDIGFVDGRFDCTGSNEDGGCTRFGLVFRSGKMRGQLTASLWCLRLSACLLQIAEAFDLFVSPFALLGYF